MPSLRSAINSPHKGRVRRQQTLTVSDYAATPRLSRAHQDGSQLPHDQVAADRGLVRRGVRLVLCGQVRGM